jgi:hypothetical protein
MASNFSWRELYKVELFQLRQEGFLPGVRPGGGDEAAFKRAYEALTGGQSFPRQSGYPYVEPDGLEEIFADAGNPPALRPLPKKDYPDRVKGAWFGRCAGLVLGKPFEMGMGRREIWAYLESTDAWPLSDYAPARSEALGIALREDCLPSTRGNVRYVQSDDDLNYTVQSLLLAEQCGEHFTLWEAGQNLLENVPYRWLWSSDRQLYRNLILLDPAQDEEAQCERIAAQMNPWREGMCPQLKADLWGYITPGETRRGARMIHRLGRLSAVKNGLYGGMFAQGCVSAALSGSPDVMTILEGGLSNIPRKSRLHEAILRVVDWYGEARDWETVCDKIYERYGGWYFAGSVNNLCFVALALLAGDLDYERTISVAVCCGTDTDCNAANAGSIAGAALGYDALPDKWIAPLNDEARSVVAGFGWGSISGLAERTVRVRESMERKGTP